MELETIDSSPLHSHLEAINMEVPQSLRKWITSGGL